MDKLKVKYSALIKIPISTIAVVAFTAPAAEILGKS